MKLASLIVMWGALAGAGCTTLLEPEPTKEEVAAMKGRQISISQSKTDNNPFRARSDVEEQANDEARRACKGGYFWLLTSTPTCIPTGAQTTCRFFSEARCTGTP